jgi:hypothetical protein
LPAAEQNSETVTIMPAKISLIGRQFGKLKVIADAPPHYSVSGKPSTRSLCICDCGKELITRNASLAFGRTTSCGCFVKERNDRLFLKHGQARAGKSSRLFWVWAAMLQRCENPNVKNFHNYGGRGIAVCAEWHDFAKFRLDMGEGKKGWSIERVNNNGNYELWNCVWATKKWQGRNTRANRIFTVRGITACLAELCERFQMDYHIVHHRITMYGWNPERALLTPVMR